MVRDAREIATATAASNESCSNLGVMMGLTRGSAEAM